MRSYSDALTLAQRDADAPQPLCEGRAAEFADYGEGAIPGEAEAAALCEGCPLIDLCFENARRTKPGWGVWGGVAWVYGRQYHLMSDEDKRSIFSDENP